MFRTMRWRFVLSHVVPLTIVVPLMGIALIYALETRVLLTSLSRELTEQGRLIAEIAAGQPQIWYEPAQADGLAADVGNTIEARLMLLNSEGVLLASSDPNDASRLGQQLEVEGWAATLAGQESVRTAYSRRLHQEIVDVLVPVTGEDAQLVGVIRLSHHQLSVREQFLQMRYLIAGVLVGGLLLGAAAGWVLALNLERPIQRANQAVRRIARGESLAPVSIEGPAETRELLGSVNALVARLHGMERARRELLANLVHELGRPLGALRSAIEAILRGAAREPAIQQELLEGMKDEVDRLRRLLDDLAGLRDQVLGTLELDRRPTPLHDWLTHALAPWREEARAKGLEWEVAIPRSLPTAEIDAERLGQALGNLVSNAIKYTPEGGSVAVVASVDDTSVRIRVSDTGPGIPPEEQERIFAPTYRRQPDKRFPQGMGLGLTIARDLVTAHGGHLDLESAVGQGSHFTIRIPLSSH
jgi:two-component system sensor histidine kinase BaeS